MGLLGILLALGLPSGNPLRQARG